MKKISLITIILCIGFIAFAQDNIDSVWYANALNPAPRSSDVLRFQVVGTYGRPVKQTNLNAARFIRDFIEGYPVNWVGEYVSAEITATCNGKAMKAMSSNDELSAAQRNMLHTADLASDVTAYIKYKTRNAATDKMETRTMVITVTVIPEIEAEYVGGYPKMAKYLQDNVITTLSETTPEQYRQGIVKFTVNEEGAVVNAKIAKTSGDAKTDRLLLDAIHKMPRWKPAINSKGNKVKQEFRFEVGGGGC